MKGACTHGLWNSHIYLYIGRIIGAFRFGGQTKMLTSPILTSTVSQS